VNGVNQKEFFLTKSRIGVSKQEWHLVWTVILFILILTSVPYAYGYMSSPVNKQFMGLMLDIPDHGQYLSWWRSFQNSVLIPNKLTPEPHEPLFFNLLWWTLAQASRITGLGYAVVFQSFRWVAGATFLCSLYRLLALLLPKVEQRRMAFLLTTFTSGFGWVLILLKYTLADGVLYYPLDVFIAEGNSFLCILAFPHFTLALTFIALIFEFIFRGWLDARLHHMVIAGVLSLILGWMHTYDLIIIYGVTGSFALVVWVKNRSFPWTLFWGGLIIVGLSFSGAVYSAILTTVDPLWKEVLAQFANAGVFTPTPFHLLILFGLPLALAIITWVLLIRNKDWSDVNLFIMSWFATGALLNYIPTDFQIHMLNSWQIPMILLATLGLSDLAGSALVNRNVVWRQKISRWMTVAVLVLILPTNIYLWIWRFSDLAQHDYPYYLHRDDIEALSWLKDNSYSDEIVLSSLTIGQYVPALSGNKAFLAHWAQTVDFYDKVDRVEGFFDLSVSDDERTETINKFNVAYVLYGPAELQLGDYDPAVAEWTELVFSSAHTRVFRIMPNLLP